MAMAYGAKRLSVNIKGLPGRIRLVDLGMVKSRDDQYSEQETQRRAEKALRAAFASPPRPQSEMKLGKPRAKRGKSFGTKGMRGGRAK
jgi:hypothetical protein